MGKKKKPNYFNAKLILRKNYFVYFKYFKYLKALHKEQY